MAASSPFSLVGKTVLVTGASSGIGRAVAQCCAAAGASVVLSGRNQVRLGETLTSLDTTAGASHTVLPCDLCDTQAVRLMVQGLPPLDGIVHCAGIGQMLLCKQIEESDVDSVMATNFKGAVMLQAELLRHKRVSKGASIVFVSSQAVNLPTAGNGVYSASKGALVSYANCLALELAPRLVRVNCILPGMVWTDLIFEGGLTEEDLRKDEAGYPLKRYGTPLDVAHLALFLLTPASSWMTGAKITLDGGRGLL